MTHHKIKNTIKKMVALRKLQSQYYTETSSIRKAEILREAKAMGFIIDVMLAECVEIINAEQIQMF